MYSILQARRSECIVTPDMAPHSINTKNNPANSPGIWETNGRAAVRNKANTAAEPIPEKNTKNAGTVSSKRILFERGGNANLYDRRKYRNAKAMYIGELINADRTNTTEEAHANPAKIRRFVYSKAWSLFQTPKQSRILSKRERNISPLRFGIKGKLFKRGLELEKVGQTTPPKDVKSFR